MTVDGRSASKTYEEESGNECDRHNRLARSELRSTSDSAVVDTLPSSLLSNDFNGRGATTLLLVDLIESGLLRASEAEELHDDGCEPK